MDLETLRSIAIQVTSELSPFKVQVLDYSDLSARIQVVSDAFKSMTLSKRFDRLYERFYGKSGIPRTFPITFEAWTISEFEQLEKSGASDKDSGDGGNGAEQSSRKVASPQSDSQHLLR